MLFIVCIVLFLGDFLFYVLVFLACQLCFFCGFFSLVPSLRIAQWLPALWVKCALNSSSLHVLMFGDIFAFRLAPHLNKQLFVLFSVHMKFLTLMIMVMNLVLISMWYWPRKWCGGWVWHCLKLKVCLWLQNIFLLNVMYRLPILWFGFVAYKMLMSLFFCSGTKKIYSSNLKEYGNVSEMERTILIFIYDVIELGLVAEFQDLLWLRQSFDAGCITVE